MSSFQLQTLTWFSTNVCRPTTTYRRLTSNRKRARRRRRCWLSASCGRWTRAPRWPCSWRRWTRSTTTCWTAVRAARLTTCRGSSPGTPRKSRRSVLLDNGQGLYSWHSKKVSQVSSAGQRSGTLGLVLQENLTGQLEMIPPPVGQWSGREGWPLHGTPRKSHRSFFFFCVPP